MGRDCDSLRAGVHPHREEETGRGVQGTVQACYVSVLHVMQCDVVY